MSAPSLQYSKIRLFFEMLILSFEVIMPTYFISTIFLILEHCRPGTNFGQFDSWLKNCTYFKWLNLKLHLKYKGESRPKKSFSKNLFFLIGLSLLHSADCNFKLKCILKQLDIIWNWIQNIFFHHSIHWILQITKS